MTAPAPNAADLVGLNDVKRWLGLQGDASGSDDLLGRLITATSMEVGSFLNRNLLASSYTETFNGNGHDRYLAKNYPLIAVTSVATYGVNVPPRPALTSSAGYSVAPLNSGGIGPSGYSFDDIAVYLSGYSFRQGVQNCTIQYIAGYLQKALNAWASGSILAGAMIQDSNGNTQVCVTAGTTGGSAPTWATTPGGTTQDGTAVWMMGMVGLPSLLPFDLVQCVVEAIGHIFKSKERIGVAELTAGAQAGSTRYLMDFPTHTLRTLRLYQRTTGF